MSEIDFGGATEGALNDLQAAASEATVVDTPTPEATPAGTESEPVTTETPSNTPELKTEDIQPTKVEEPKTPEEELEELIYNGQVVRLPKNQVKDLAQKGFDYTQKRMADAEAEKQRQNQFTEAYSELQRNLAAVQEAMRDDNKLAELRNAYRQQNGLPIDPSDIPTVEQTQQLIKSQVAEVRKQLGTDLQRATFELETKRLENEYSVALNSHVEALTKQHPVLSDIDGIERILRDEVAANVAARIKADPNKAITLEETQKMFSQAAERRATKIEARFNNMVKEKAVKQAAIIKTGIEPPGGTTPVPVQAKTPKLGSKELHELVLGDLMAGKG